MGHSKIHRKIAGLPAILGSFYQVQQELPDNNCCNE
jgi:hypothetical protein